MCPVRAAVEIVQRIYSYGIPEDKIKDIQINFMKLGSLTYTIPSSLIMVRLRALVQTLGIKKLGFGPEEIGTHSNRSGGAMGMFLAGTPVYTIMLMSRWSSDAFMRYLRKTSNFLKPWECNKNAHFREILHRPRLYPFDSRWRPKNKK